MLRKFRRIAVLELCLTLLLALPACSGIPITGGNPTPPVTSTQPMATPPSSIIPTNASSNPLMSKNLIVNGDAEMGPSTTNILSIEPIPGWTRHGSINVIQYATNDSSVPFLTRGSPGPSDRGKNYFYGGADDIPGYGDNRVTSMTQNIDVLLASTLIATGHIKFTLSGWLGGFSNQNDNAEVSVQFVSPSSQSLGTTNIGPVLATDRNNQTSLLQRTVDGKVPAGTAKINITVTMTRLVGPENEGSIDNLSLTIHP